MPRTQTISDEEILRIAGEAFLQEGVRASTRGIARRAGISEALLFKRFGTRETLFSRALAPGLGTGLESLGDMVGQGPLRENLVTLGLRILAELQRFLPRFILLWSSRSIPAFPPKGFEEPGSRAGRALADYFRAEREGGRLGPVDPEALTQAFLGGLQGYALKRLQSGKPELGELAFVEGLVGILWEGIAPKD